ncbi:MAG: hypothetical protein ACR652_11600 [Methylocystis sp.]|uniref:hypothetical protein n=1 Tax=Methylocystis sp. TaxID=1911079 RepID=UPI003DA3BCE1
MLSVQSSLLREARSYGGDSDTPRRAQLPAFPSNRLAVGLPTLIGLAPMLGHRLDDRATIAQRQASILAERFEQESELPLPQNVGPWDFFVAPLDILPFRRAGQRRFQLLELNGTGIGGITNLPTSLVEDILETIGEIGAACQAPAPLALVASSGRETQRERKPSHLLHEKMLFVDRIARSLERRFGDVQVLALDTLVSDGGWRGPARPTVALGYTRELVDHVDVVAGAPRLFGRDVSAIVNDRFLYNLEAAHGPLNLGALLPANRCYRAGADKATAYRHVNSLAARNGADEIGAAIRFEICNDVDELIEAVRSRLHRGEQLVIKPSGTGHGDGIEFFFNNEGKKVVEEKIARSLAIVRQRYGQGAGFPYTVTEYLDAETVRALDHPLQGRKFELRVVVYRKGSMLRAAPSIAKVAPEVWDPTHPTRGALINNVSASVRSSRSCGADHVLPLCLPETLAALDLDENILSRLCRWATAYVAHVLAETRTELEVH